MPAVAQVTKMGLTFVLNRETGQPVWPVEERPVPLEPVAGEYVSPTQPFPTHLPALISTPIAPEDAWGFTFWDRGVCEDKGAALRNEGIYTPPSLKGNLFYPSNAGGSGGAQRGSPYCMRTRNLASPLGVPCTAPPWSTPDAIDLVAGKVLWSAPLGTTWHLAPCPSWWIKGVPAVGGPAATGSGLIFIGGAMDHYFRAFDAETGTEFWRHELPTAANATAMT